MRIPNDQVQVGRAGEVANYRVPYSGRLVGTHNIVVRASFRRNFHDVQNSTTTDRLRLRCAPGKVPLHRPPEQSCR